MFTRLIIIVFCFVIGHACASSPTNTEQVPSPTSTPLPYEFDRTKAKSISDSIVDELIKNERDALFSKMETEFRNYYNKDAFDGIIDKMFGMFGSPIEAEFKKAGQGRRVGSGGYDKPMIKHWYAVRTSKHDYGSHFIFVEIVPDGDVYASSGVAIVNFPMGVPDDMK